MSKTNDLIEQLDAAFATIVGVPLWQHYKGGIYGITGVVFDTNIDEPAYVYRRFAGPDFNEEVEKDIRFTRPVSDRFTILADGRKRFEPLQTQ